MAKDLGRDTNLGRPPAEIQEVNVVLSAPITEALKEQVANKLDVTNNKLGSSNVIDKLILGEDVHPALFNHRAGVPPADVQRPQLHRATFTPSLGDIGFRAYAIALSPSPLWPVATKRRSADYQSDYRSGQYSRSHLSSYGKFQIRSAIIIHIPRAKHRRSILLAAGVELLRKYIR